MSGPNGHLRKDKRRAARVAGWRCCDAEMQRGGGRNIPNAVCVTVFEVPVRYPCGDVSCVLRCSVVSDSS